eukprot:5121636-Amphidinium_carterae.1
MALLHACESACTSKFGLKGSPNTPAMASPAMPQGNEVQEGAPRGSSQLEEQAVVLEDAPVDDAP